MKYFWGVVIFPVFLVIFMLLEYGRMTVLAGEVVQPLIFTLVIELIYLRVKRLPILWFASALLVLMVIFYLFNFLLLANWIGSLGFGMLFITISSYMPELFKHGLIEKF